MKINFELEFDVQFFEDTDGYVTLEAVRFPGCTQNLIPFMSDDEVKMAQEELESKVQEAAIAKVQKLLERKQMAGDCRRDLAKDGRVSA